MTEQHSQERCPCCNKEMKWFGDYPLMQIVSVSFIKPEEVPAIIRGGGFENLIEKLKPGRMDFKQNIVPSRVIAYFTANPGESEYLYSNGFIYQKQHSPTIQNTLKPLEAKPYGPGLRTYLPW